MKLTQAVVKSLVPIEGQAQSEFWDDDQPGFGVRVGRSGRKVFFVYSRVNGRKVRATVGKFPELNLDDARKKARAMLVEMFEGVNPNDGRKQRSQGELALNSVFDTFLATRKNLSERTRDEYRGIFDRHLSGWKPRHVGEITTDLVIQRHREIGENKGKNVANHSIRLLRTILNFSKATYGVPQSNPVSIMSSTRAWYKDGRRSVIVKGSDMPLFFKEVLALENDTGRDYLILLLFTGLRRNEGMGLRWENVDLQGKTLTVPETKNGEPHTLPLSTYLVDLLKARQERWGGKGWVFPSWSEKGHLTYIQHTLNVLRAKGLHFTLHDLRRTFITTAEGLDISTYVVKRLANHKQSDVTGKHYIVHDVERLREPMERIAAAILSAGKQPAT